MQAICMAGRIKGIAAADMPGIYVWLCLSSRLWIVRSNQRFVRVLGEVRNCGIAELSGIVPTRCY